MASGWVWVWLECIGVVSGCCCKEVYRSPHNITYPYSTCISSFFCSRIHTCIYFFAHFKNVFLFLFVIFVQYSKRCLKKLRSREHGNIIISTRTCVNCAHESPETSKWN